MLSHVITIGSRFITTPAGQKTSCFVSTGEQYHAPTSWEGTAMRFYLFPEQNKVALTNMALVFATSLKEKSTEDQTHFEAMMEKMQDH